MTKIKKFTKGFLLFQQMKDEIRRVAYRGLLERQMSVVLLPLKLELKGLLWATWGYAKWRERRYRTAVNLKKLNILSKAMLEIKKKVEYRKKL